MARKRFIDLSISIEPDLPSDPPIMIPKVDYINHEIGAEQQAHDAERNPGGGIRPDDGRFEVLGAGFPDGAV